jgi:hypothetical protein
MAGDSEADDDFVGGASADVVDVFGVPPSLVVHPATTAKDAKANAIRLRKLPASESRSDLFFVVAVGLRGVLQLLDEVG